MIGRGIAWTIKVGQRACVCAFAMFAIERNRKWLREVTCVIAVLVASFASAQIKGEVWQGKPGILESLTEIMSRPPLSETIAPSIFDQLGYQVDRTWLKGPGQVAATMAGRCGSPYLPQSIGTSFDAITRAESLAVPPQPTGGVSETQVLVATNGRIKVFDKDGNLGYLNTSLDAFFQAVRGPYSVRNPQVRYDKTSGRWFVVALTSATSSNSVLIGISSGSLIHEGSFFNFFSFAQDEVAPTPNVDSGRTADNLSLGIDVHALYIGVNMFAVNFAGTSAFVIKKASLFTTAGPIEATAFRNLTGSPTGRGMFAPQGVDNEDLAATEGYFIGVDNAILGRLMMRRVSDPGGVPVMSSDIELFVPATSLPVNVPALGSIRPISPVDDRLMGARITINRINGIRSLWTAHAIGVNALGNATFSNPRNGIRWYQVHNLTTNPGTNMTGTAFDPTATPVHYFLPSVAMTGQGHLVIGATSANGANPLGAGSAGRYRFDAIGATQGMTQVVSGSAGYNVDSTTPQRWGTYGAAAIDPLDGQTAWIFQPYCNAPDSWAVRVTKLVAPPPPVLNISQPGLVRGSSLDLILSGSVVEGSEFFDPGPEFPNRTQLTISGEGVTINSMTVTTPTQINFNVSIASDAPVGVRTVTVTNPDGQSTSVPFEVRNPQPNLFSINPISTTAGTGPLTVTATGSNFQTDSTATFNDQPCATTFVSSTELTFELTAEMLAAGAISSIRIVSTGPGVNPSPPLPFVAYNPRASVTAVEPATIPIDSPETTITVRGSEFVPTSVVKFGSIELATTFVSANEVTAILPAEHLTIARTVAIGVHNPSPGGGTPLTTANLTIANPLPVITSFDPPSVMVGSAEITLTVTGSDFRPDSVVRFAAVDRVTTFVSSSELRAQIPADQFLDAGQRTVRVVTPGPGGGIAGPLTFFVNNPVPVLVSLDPTSVNQGSGAFLLTVTGDQFVPTSTIRWNGLDRSTTFVNGNTLQCTIPLSFLISAGYADVTVFNREPGGGLSNPLQFAVNAPAPTISSLTPDHAEQNGFGFEITVAGSGFRDGCVVRFDGMDRVTTFVSSTSVKAQILDEDLFTVGPHTITVQNPQPSPESLPVTFTVTYPAPGLVSVTPQEIPAGSPDVEVQLVGYDFAPNAFARLGGVNLPTVVLSSTELMATVPAAEVASGRVAQMVVVNPEPGGGESVPRLITVVNPVPTTTSISPDVVVAGGPSFELTVIGTNFVPSSVVTLNSLPRPTTYVSSTELRATVQASDYQAGGAAAIRVSNPGPGGGISSPYIELRFVNPVPTISTISPDHATAGSEGFELTVNGSSFVTTSVVTWNGSIRPTTFVSSTILRVAISASDVASAGSANVRVVNFDPGGGSTVARVFAISPAGSALVLPSQIDVLDGELFDGDLQQLFLSDDAYVSLFNSPDTLSCQVAITGFAATSTATNIRLDYESSATRPGLAQQVHMYNFFGQRFQSLEGSTAPTADRLITLQIPTPSQFVGPSNELRYRITWSPINDEDPSVDGWLHLIDLVRWFVVP